VSDKVFAPSPWRRAAQAGWNSSARLGFVSPALLSCALVVTALYRPVPAPAGTALVSQVQADFDRRVQTAVQRALAESEARQAEKTARLIQDFEKRSEIDRQGLLVAVSESMDLMRKQRNVYMHAVNDLASPQQGVTQ